MRWERLQLDVAAPEATLFPGAVARTFDTPRFRGLTFYEVPARSIINRVPDTSPVPFRWTINPYRGCTHARSYCFARNTHTYLDLDSGRDFERKIIVKVNAGELLRRVLRAGRAGGEHIAMGTNTDPYQRVEGRYRLMRELLTDLHRRRPRGCRPAATRPSPAAAHPHLTPPSLTRPSGR